MGNAQWTFFQAFLKAPTVVASAIPSSGFLERRLVETARVKQARTVVELGAGTGGTTRALLNAMGENTRLLAIERTEEFVAGLNGIRDSRLEVVHGCASDIGRELERLGAGPADAVISGIPFSTMPSELCRRIIREIHAALGSGGRFVAYQFTDRVADYARPVLGAAQVDHELLNIPPLRVFSWEKA